MDGDFVLNMDEVIQSIENADVMSLYLPALSKAVVIDTRSNETDGPMIALLPMAASPEERLRSLRRLRPSFPRVSGLTVVEWTRYVDSLVTLGVWDRIVQRFVESGQDDAVGACETVLSELRRLERAELTAAVLGVNYHTLWPPEEADSS